MSLKFEDNEICTGIDIPTSLSTRLEAIRNRLKEKYNINYVEVDAIDKDNKCILFNIGNKLWNDYLWKSKYIHLWPEMDKNGNFALLSDGKNLFCYHDKGWVSQSSQVRILADDHAELRAGVIGEYQPYIYEIKFHNPSTGNKTQFCISFYNHQSIVSLGKDIFFQLMNDLKSAETILEPYIEYFKEHGNLKESLLLNEKVKENPFHLRF